jgi:hypothetical protein
VGDDRLMVSEGAGKALFNLLSNSGTLRGRTLDQIHERLIEVVNRLWEGGKTTSFVDNQGGGWMIDISRGFGDVMLYAIVRSTGGTRGVVDVIDEGELEAMKNAPNEPLKEPQAEVTARTKERRPPFQPPVEPQPESPALLRWISERGDGMNKGPKYDEEELKYSEVGDRVQALLRDGVDPRDIEIWTARKKPQVRVELV